MAMSKKRLLIVGGVAGGASCAARARRMSEEAEIILFERGPFVSFANCGLPYHVGGVIPEEGSLLVATPELLQNRFKIQVRLRHNVEGIDRAKHEISVRNLETGEVSREHYDVLVLSPGAAPFIPNVSGNNLPGIFVVRSIQDSRDILSFMAKNNPQKAVVAGGGFIGLEMAENLHHKGLSVTMVEMLPQLMPPLDPEMAVFLQDHLASHGVTLFLGERVMGFAQKPEGGIAVALGTGRALDADMVVLAVGVRPESGLAAEAGLLPGENGGILVDAYMRTSDPDIFAVGDAVQVRGRLFDDARLVALAGPANLQGRIAADTIMSPENERPGFSGSLGTFVCGVMGMTVAGTGECEKSLKRLGAVYEKIYCHPYHHATYYPGAASMTLKLLFSPEDGRILGAQAVGGPGVDKRMDVISMAIQKNGTVFDLESAQLCYAPQFGSAKDPVNIAGMVAANTVRGLVRLVRWEDIGSTQALVLDVRTPVERAMGHVPGSLHIPLDSLRDRLHELPRDREIWAYCAAGQRSYYAVRILAQHGFMVRNLSGGYAMYRAFSRRAA